MGWRVEPWEPATPAEGGQRQLCRREGKSSPAHRACGGTPSPQGRFKYACSARCAAGMRSVGVGRRRWVPGRRDKKKEKKKPKAKGSCPPPFFFQHTRIVFHQLAPLAGPLRPPGHAAVIAGRRACEGCAWLGTPCPGVRTRAGDRAMGPGPREGRHRPPPGVAALGHVPHPPRTAPPSSAWALASASSSRFR